MILFKPEHVPLILYGTKTETRRMWKKPHVTVGSIQKAKTQMLSKEYFALLKIKEIYKENLFDVSEESAKAEGGYTRVSYLNKFFEINPCTYSFYQTGLPLPVYVVKFELVRSEKKAKQ